MVKMYQSISKQSPDEEDSWDSLPSKPATRDKGPSRCYNLTMVAVYFALLVMAAVTLGTFGVKEAEIINRENQLRNHTDRSCILFSTYEYTDPNSHIVIQLHSSGLCGYVFWGLTSITIVAFAWIINSIVQAVTGPKV